MDQVCFTETSSCCEWRPNRFKPTKCGNCGCTLPEHAPGRCPGITDEVVTKYLDVVACQQPCSLVIAATEGSHGQWGSLSIGSKDGARRGPVETHRIGAVAQTARGLEEFFPPWGREIRALEAEGVVEVFRANWVDAVEQELNAGETLEQAVAFIHLHRRQGTNVLVNCAAGKSRSGSLLIAYLMAVHGNAVAGGCIGELPESRNAALVFYDTLLSFVQSKRAIVEPNSSFKDQLIAFALSDGLRRLRASIGVEAS